MNTPRLQIILVAAAVAAALAGIILTARTAIATPTMLQHIKRKYADLQQLRALKERHDADRAAVLMFVSLKDARATSFAELLRSQPAAHKAEVHPRDSRPLIEGWSLKRIDVMLDDMPLVDLGRLLNSGENQRPPWRMSECTIAPSDTKPGAARVTLVMETLESSNP